MYKAFLVIVAPLLTLLHLVDIRNHSVHSNARPHQVDTNSVGRREVSHQEHNSGCLGTRENCRGSFGITLPSETAGPVVTGKRADTCAEGWNETAWKAAALRFRKHKPRSSHNEDLIVYEKFFKGRKPFYGGVYMEMGAFDGISEANTRFYEECLGWSGILMEGSPGNYKTLIDTARRPSAIKLHMLPSCQELTAVDFLRYDNSAGTVAKLGQRDSRVPVTKVHCAPLPYYLRQLQVTQFDFFSLDVEGSEVEVLSSMEGLEFHVVMVEVYNRQCGSVCEKREKVRQRMQELGFDRMENVVKKSDIYVNRSCELQYVNDT